MHDFKGKIPTHQDVLESFKTVNGMEACTTHTQTHTLSDNRTVKSFKTVNGMEACTTG